MTSWCAPWCAGRCLLTLTRRFAGCPRAARRTRCSVSVKSFWFGCGGNREDRRASQERPHGCRCWGRCSPFPCLTWLACSNPTVIARSAGQWSAGSMVHTPTSFPAPSTVVHADTSVDPRREHLAKSLATVLDALRQAEIPTGAANDPHLQSYRGEPLATMDRSTRENLERCRFLEDFDLDIDAEQVWAQAMKLPGTADRTT